MSQAATIQEVICEQLGVCEAPLDAVLTDDLGADSLDVVELIMALEERLNVEIPDNDAEGMRTVQDVVDYIDGRQG